MSDPCQRLHEYYDGELSAADAEDVRAHLGDCSRCQAELLELAQLGALERELASAQGGGKVVALPWFRRPRTLLIAALPVAAAAALFLFWRARRAEPVILARADHRGIEGRLSHPAAADYRPYDIERAGAAQPESIPLAALAELEERGDLHGVATGYLLLAEPKRAATYLERMQPGPDVASDRAVALLQSGEPKEAVLVLAPALAAAPEHPQALWNRALAYRDLHLSLAAASELDRVAALGEPGWSDEARARAAALREDTEARIAAYKAFYERAMKFAAGSAEMTPDELTAFPGLGRQLFYHAVRAAPSRDAVMALLPHARALDAEYGGDWVEAFVRRAADADFAVREPLARRYAAIVAGERPDADAAAAYLAALRRAGADAEDILIGALAYVGPAVGRVASSGLADLSRYAEATGDPWFRLFAAEQIAQDALDHREVDRAEAALLQAWPLCEGDAILYRCAKSAQILARGFLTQHRAGVASRFAHAAWDVARRGRDHWLELGSLILLAKSAELSDDISARGLPLARAYMSELLLRAPEACAYQIFAHEILTMMLVNSARMTEAREQHALLRQARKACGDQPLTLSGAYLDAHIYAEDAPDEAVERVRRDLDRLREDPTATPGIRALTDHIEGRLLFFRDPKAARRLLRRAIDTADQAPRDTEARQGRGYSFALLVMDAGRRDEYAAALALLAEETGVAVPERCVLGVAIGEAWTAVARGPDGSVAGYHSVRPPARSTEAAELVPARVRRHLSGCESVDVLARPPVHGRAGVLPPSMAWRYLSRHDQAGRDGAEPAEQPAPRRLVVTGAEPPAVLGLARLGDYRSSEPADVTLRGAAATPSRVLAAMEQATEIEIHAHGLVDLGVADASFIALSPEPDGDFALTAADLRGRELAGAPLVILGACHAAQGALEYHEPWSLPAAFIEAGARAVIASPAPIADVDAAAFFADVRRRIRAGTEPAVALRDAREAWRGRPGAEWVTTVLLFE